MSYPIWRTKVFEVLDRLVERHGEPIRDMVREWLAEGPRAAEPARVEGEARTETPRDPKVQEALDLVRDPLRRE